MRSLQFSVPMSRSPVAVRARIPPPEPPFVAVSGAFDGGGWERGWSSAEALLGRGDAEQVPCWAGRALLDAGAPPHPLPSWQPWGQQAKPLWHVSPDLESGWMNKTAFFFYLLSKTRELVLKGAC